MSTGWRAGIAAIQICAHLDALDSDIAVRHPLEIVNSA